MFSHRFFSLGTAVLLLAVGLMWPAARADGPTLLVVGDSLSAGYGIDFAQGWVNLLQQRLREAAFPHRVVNDSISGDTSRGGLARLPAALERHRPAFVILELGGNDGLRGLSLQALKANLAAMIELCRAAGVRVLLAEMRIPPNYGPVYTKKFQAVYGDLADQYGIPLIPFLLDGVAGNGDLMQEDGIHPRAEAQARILENVWPVVEAVLNGAEAPARRPAAARRSSGPCVLFNRCEGFALRSM
jgi:acyl-CoA thioesterase-1